MQTMTGADLDSRYRELEQLFPMWEKTKDLIDQFIDVMLNYRQSGHPGGSRSKVHTLVTALLSGVSRWDIRHPEKRFGDRIVFVGGHTAPLGYATLAVLNEALRAKYERTGDPRYLVPKAEERMLTWEDLLKFRRNKGLSGHCEFEGKSLFFKFNTGPSAHGSPVAAGEALALKRAGAEGVKVFAVEGEGGLTPGGVHETQNSAWGLGLDNLYYLVDWNDFGIDDHRISDVVYGTPDDWFGAHGWRTFGAEQGSEWSSVAKMLLSMVEGPNPGKVPSAGWFKTRKGREYGVYDNKSHGVPHKMNSEPFWATKKPFVEKYGAKFEGFGQPAPTDPIELQAQFRANLKAVADVLRADEALVDYLADRLVELGDSVPERIPTFRLDTAKNPWKDERLYDYENYPKDLYVAPGTSIANRAALAKYGAWLNAFGKEEYGQPLFLAASADLADSTNISGFASDFGEMKGWGRYNRQSNPEGALLPQEITEFANAGIMVGMTSVNFAEDPDNEFQGFYGACSTYGAFVYLKYGLFRLFSQASQDGQLKMGKVLWIAGHSGPETADDSRTHFGVFSPGVTQLFPDGHIIDLHPWEYNEVPVALGAALKQPQPLIALHLTRPPISIPDRAALGMPSHFAAAKGAYVIRNYRPGQKRMGTVIVQGTSTVANVVKVLPEFEKAGLNIKIVCAVSPQLFRIQPASYQQSVLSTADKIDSMTITNGARRLMHDWLFSKVSEEYSMSSDWDNRWRTGGTVDEVIEEAHLSPKWIVQGIERFAADREKRLGALALAVLVALVYRPRSRWLGAWWVRAEPRMSVTCVEREAQGKHMAPGLDFRSMLTI